MMHGAFRVDFQIVELISMARRALHLVKQWKLQT
jgi:hypothetical protein